MKYSSKELFDRANVARRAMKKTYSLRKRADLWRELVAQDKPESEIAKAFEMATETFEYTHDQFAVVKTLCPYLLGLYWGVSCTTLVIGGGHWFLYQSRSGWESLGPVGKNGDLLPGITYESWRMNDGDHDPWGVPDFAW